MLPINMMITSSQFLLRHKYVILLFIAFFILAGCNKEDEHAKEPGVYANVSNKADDSYSPIGQFKINNTLFQVPRSYIPFQTNRKNGDVEAINLRFFLPDFISESDRNINDREAYLRDVVHVLVEKCSGDKCKNISFINFKNTIRLRGGIDSGCLQGEGREAGGIELRSYIINSTNSQKSEREMFISGNPCKPDFYLVCGTDNSAKYPSCKRWFYYRDNILVNYIFRRTYLKDYKYIEDTLISKLDDYTSKNSD